MPHIYTEFRSTLLKQNLIHNKPAGFSEKRGDSQDRRDRKFLERMTWFSSQDSCLKILTFKNIERKSYRFLNQISREILLFAPELTFSQLICLFGLLNFIQKSEVLNPNFLNKFSNFSSENIPSLTHEIRFFRIYGKPKIEDFPWV